MKILLLILKLFALSALIPIALISIAGFFIGDYLVSSVLIIITSLPSFFIIRSIMKNAKMQQLPLKFETEFKALTHEKPDIANEVSKPLILMKDKEIAVKPFLHDSNNNDLFLITTIKFKSKQLLESLEIIDTTTRIDTLSSRIEFVNTIYPDLIKASRYGRYIAEIQKGIDMYKTMYYDRMIKDEQAQLLLFPSHEDMKHYFSTCIARCYERYVDRQKTELIKLVRTSAIEKRREDLIRQGYNAKYLFKTYDLPDNGNMDAIEQLRQQFFHKTFTKKHL